MRRNHFHSSGNSKRANALKHGYKSGLELTISEQIKQTEYELCYETETLNYVVPERKAKYTPDFVFTKRNGTSVFIQAALNLSELALQTSNNIVRHIDLLI